MLSLYQLFEGDEPGEPKGAITDEDILSCPEKTAEIQSAVINLILKKKLRPDDDDIHALAGKFNMDPHEFEEVIYALLGDLVKGVGKHKEVPDSKFDPKQLKMGVDVEKEHIDNPYIRLQIAKDHLAEIPDYYTRLKIMEDSAKKKGE
jgi:hypothetical protein